MLQLAYLPEEIRTYLTHLCDTLRQVLGSELYQVFSVGSTSYASGYVPGLSDIDVVVVTRSRISEKALERVTNACSHDTLPCPAAKLELVIYAYDAVHLDKPSLPYEILLNHKTGETLVKNHIRYGNDPDDSPHWFILDIAAAHTNNAALLDGPSFAEVFTPRPRK